MSTTQALPFLVQALHPQQQMLNTQQKGSDETAFQVIMHQALRLTENAEDMKTANDLLEIIVRELDQLVNEEDHAEKDVKLEELLQNLWTLLNDEAPNNAIGDQGEFNIADQIMNEHTIPVIPLILVQPTLIHNVEPQNGQGLLISELQMSKIVDLLLSFYQSIQENGNNHGKNLKGLIEKALGKLAETAVNENLAVKLGTEGNKQKLWDAIMDAAGKIVAEKPSTQSNSFLTVVSNILQSKDKHEQAVTSFVSSLELLPMSKLEQFTIYLGRHQSTATSTQQQFMEQLEQIMKITQFNQKNGTLELTIKLKPAHLGDMMINFTQVNGEMAVKISVSTSSAKELLEANINQLKSMFSPNQVIIEKQQIDATHEATSYLNQENYQEDNQQQRNQEEMEETRDEQNSSIGKKFEEILSQLSI
jgi:Flagellar hook-length control protein FliK